MNAILFQPTGEVRKAHKGDMIMESDGGMLRWFTKESEKEHPIYTRHEIPAEVAERMLEEAK
jgi:hypothetical protein